MKGWITLGLVVLFCCFCIYVYKVRTAFNVDKRDVQIKQQTQRLKVVKYAFSLLPKKEMNEVFFNSIDNMYPNFKEDKYLCEILGYCETPKTEEKIEEKTTIKDTTVKDTTVIEVMDNVVGFFN